MKGCSESKEIDTPRKAKVQFERDRDVKMTEGMEIIRKSRTTVNNLPL